MSGWSNQLSDAGQGVYRLNEGSNMLSPSEALDLQTGKNQTRGYGEPLQTRGHPETPCISLKGKPCRPAWNWWTLCKEKSPTNCLSDFPAKNRKASTQTEGEGRERSLQSHQNANAYRNPEFLKEHTQVCSFFPFGGLWRPQVTAVSPLAQAWKESLV